MWWLNDCEDAFVCDFFHLGEYLLYKRSMNNPVTFYSYFLHYIFEVTWFPHQQTSLPRCGEHTPRTSLSELQTWRKYPYPGETSWNVLLGWIKLPLAPVLKENP